jgi:hypothetical protein
LEGPSCMVGSRWEEKKGLLLSSCRSENATLNFEQGLLQSCVEHSPHHHWLTHQTSWSHDFVLAQLSSPSLTDALREPSVNETLC